MLNAVIFSCIVGLLGVIIAVLYFKKKGKTPAQKNSSSNNKPPTPPTPPAPPAASKDLAQIAIDNLLVLNIFVRTKKVPVDILELVEKMIDNLRAATPAMIERHPDHDLTYELKEICSKHIMKQLKEFFDMSEGNQEKYMAGLKERLNEMAELIKRARDIVENDEVSEMKMIAGFLETKYSNPVGN